MKLGSENSKKTIAAVALFIVAVYMVIRMISGSSGPAPAPVTTTATATPTARPTTRRTVRTAGGRKAAHDKANTPVTPSLDPRLHLAELKQAEDTTYDGTGRNIFMATEEPKIPTPVASGITKGSDTAKITPPPPPQRPAAPPINLKFFGFASGPDHKRIFLSSGDDVFVATEGDIVQRRYKIVKVNANNIEVLDVLSNNRQTIPLTAG